MTDNLVDVEPLRARPWNEDAFTPPPEIFKVPGMLNRQEQHMLHYLARHYFSGEGAIVDLGACLGRSTISLATGLRARNVKRPVLHSFDLFKLGTYEQERFFPDNPPDGLKTRAIF